MKQKIVIPIVLLAILGFTIGGYLLGRHSHDFPPDTVTVSENEEAHQWTCSMHPFIIRDKPGLCPICAMDLVPVYDKSGDGGGVTIDPATSQNMGVRIAPVMRQDISRSIKTVGVVTADESRQSSINSKVEGWIEKLYVDQTGKPVRKGAPLLEIYSPDLVSAQQEYLLALRNSERLADNPYPEIAQGAQRLRAAARTRLKYWDISDKQISTLEQSGEARKTLTLYSPSNGIVMMKNALPGMRVMPGEELLQITDLSKIWVDAQLYEYQLPVVQVGQNAEIILPYSIGKVLRGKIAYIYPNLSGETRTARARIELPNPGLELKPEMYVDVNIAGVQQSAALVIPTEAILDSGEQQTVFVALGEGRFEPRIVRSGVKDDSGNVEILDGLQEGEQVVISAQFMLDSESRLREALQKMSAPPEEKPKENLDDLFK
ncbi:MAG: efflux RND transporter periplasmic adaptor subunit [Deltaproteobacteria bacterium HGW-Deltaproteobacteria-4]|nr:MAG: efflux RND transporter periplasmic adaptor subunit [Deltaproteobacteria bacterium HGW-Deltaproteobacteria-4]